MDFNVSVIIPAYNAEKYIEKAINSVLNQTEVHEIIVVNDGSSDGTLKIVERIQKFNPIIKIYHHSNKENKGRSATRNLGIKKATGNFIAFLDADDFYLKNRFKSDKKIFQENANVDGVYNAIGVHFYRSSSALEKESLELYTIKEKIKPEKLFETLVNGNKGHFSIDGLTLKRSVFNKVGLFNVNLNVMEDTELIWKIALKCKLESGVINKPVAKRGVHDSNVFNKEELYNKNYSKVYESLISWASKNRIPLKNVDLLMKWLWIFRTKEKNNLMHDIKYWIYIFRRSPNLLFTHLCLKYFPIVRNRQIYFPFFFKPK